MFYLTEDRRVYNTRNEWFDHIRQYYTGYKISRKKLADTIVWRAIINGSVISFCLVNEKMHTITGWVILPDNNHKNDIGVINDTI